MKEQPEGPGAWAVKGQREGPDVSAVIVANCPCLNHCRLWEETHDGKYPPSRHAPSCEHFRTEPFLCIEHDGSWCVVEPKDAPDMLVGESEYTVSTVQLTRDQFDNMPEFAGF